MKNYKLYDGKITLSFDDRPRKHIYYVNDKVVYGTTSICGVLDKPAIKYWAVNMAIESLQANLTAGKALDEVEIKTLLENARKAHTQRKDRAADIGTIGHQWLEDYVKARLAKKTPPKRPVNKELKKGIAGFFKWAKENKVKLIASEQKIYSKKWKFAGTFDLEAMVNGKRTIIDFKFSKAIYPEYFLQSSAYLKAKQEETGKEYPGGVIILRLSKNLEDTESFEAVKDTNVETHFKCFLNCLQIFKWKQMVKKQAIINRANGYGKK